MKFRIWHKKDNEWFSPKSGWTIPEFITLGLAFSYPYNEDLLDLVEICGSDEGDKNRMRIMDDLENDFEFYLFMPIKDINGTEICEGDIVIWRDRIGVVKFNGGIFYVENSGEIYDFIPAFKRDADTLWEVIGNIKDNPELLESKKKEQHHD